jgi:hypothetical protein
MESEMKKILLLLIFALSPQASAENIFWTIKIKGIYVSNSGQAAIAIKGTPSSPNPSGTTWTDCKKNWIYFHKNVDGELTPDKYLDRMLSVAMSAQKTQTSVRVGIARSPSNYCYTYQIFDLGQ